MKEDFKLSKMAHYDAIGNPIELGKKYGWAGSDNGFTQVTIGIAEKFTKKGVTLKVESAKKGLYDSDPTDLIVGGTDLFAVKSKINIKGMRLFPIN